MPCKNKNWQKEGEVSGIYLSVNFPKLVLQGRKIKNLLN
jgi:hypothetical protein